MLTPTEIGGGLLGALALGSLMFEDALSKRRRSPDSARFAGRRELKLLREADGVPLGFHGQRELHAERNASVLLCGPAQSGKSLSCVVRAIREWDGCLIVLSIKEELLTHTLAAREQRGEVKIFDPTGQTDYPSQAWSPIAASDTWPRARAMAAALLEIGQADRMDREPHWRRTAARYLAPLLLAANEASANMRAVLSWIDLVEKKELQAVLGSSLKHDASVALENLEGIWKTDARYQGSVLGTLSTALDAWQEPGVAAATGTPDITPEWLCFGANTLYIVAPAHQQQRLQNLFGGLLVHLIDEAMTLAQRSPGGRLSPALLCALDEVCNAAPLPTLGRYASSGPGQGVLLLSVIQDYAQAIDTWGRERASSILANHRAKLFWSGTDPDTLRYVSQALGDQEVPRSSTTRHRGEVSRTDTTERRPLIAPSVLREAPRHQALLVYGHLPPVWLTERIAV